MKKIIFCLTLLFSITMYSQQNNYKEYSYSQFFKLIDQETDSIFKLSDALIKFNPKTDQRFVDKFSDEDEKRYQSGEKIIVNKPINLQNVHFLTNKRTDKNGNRLNYWDGVVKDIHFKKSVLLKECVSINILNCTFDDTFEINTLYCELEGVDALASGRIDIMNSSFLNNFDLFRNCFQSSANLGNILVADNQFISNKTKSIVSILILNSSSLSLSDNTFNINGVIRIASQALETYRIRRNIFNTSNILLNLSRNNSNYIRDNKFPPYVNLYTDELNSKDDIDWMQFENKLTTSNSFSNYSYDNNGKRFSQLDSLEQKKIKREYLDSARFYNKKYYVKEVALKGLFYDYYKKKYDTETANEVYIELKDFETKRMAALYSQKPNFKTYFTWKTNQFLKVFSAYGTEPARAIIFSLYVILIFALIYLFFPNHWDSHGKNRIVDRYNFFFKYMKQKAGIHEVYLEDQKEELMSYDQFKANIKSSKQQVPKFFTITALPIYKWAISGTKMSASFLSKIDIMKGTWNDLPKSKRIWKAILLIGAFLIAIIYDILIKMLNALMLSINTFTTLGFGEIPIKGLPRYLAIIQGFIGWFMLTIFSVSLISQLLN